MDIKEAIAKVDHTLLKPFASRTEIDQICEEAISYHTASVCIPPSYISYIKDKYGDQINICTVIGFPLGYQTTATKVFEAEDAIKNGASEIDMVINIGDVKNGDFDKVKEEIVALRKATAGHILKVIVETCYLTEEEKIKLCEIVTEAKADFIKTSTGFGDAGATKEDILLFKEHIGSDVKMKAAGGIRTKEDFMMYIDLGCDRVGASKTKEFIQG